MEKKELSMEIRLLIAFALMGLVLFITPYVIKTPPPQPDDQGKTAKTAEVKPVVPPTNTDGKPVEVPGQVQASQLELPSIDNDHFRVVFSNQGAVVRSWVLKGVKDHQGRPLDLVNSQAMGKLPGPFALYFKNQKPQADPDTALFQVHHPDPLTLEFDYSDGRTAFHKSFHFTQSGYLADISSRVSQNGVLLPHALAWRGGFGDSTVVNPANYQLPLYYDLPNTKLNEKAVKDAKNGPVSSSGEYSFAGLEDTYFAGVFLPAARTPVEFTIFSDNLIGPDNKDEARVGAAVGGEGANSFRFYLGPKDGDILAKVDTRLEPLISWGFWGFLAKYLFEMLRWTADHVTHNYGWGIVLVTLAINMLLLPLKITSMKSSRQMQALQPQIAALNEKYKNLSMRDPRKAEQNQEMMDLYKKHNVNPVGGCLPMLLQFPFLLAFYTVLRIAPALRGAGWLWIPDLSQPETLAIHLLPILLVVTQFASQRMTPAPGMDPAQQKMMMLMPLVFGFMFYGQPAGLVLYWLTGNVVGIAQQWLLNRTTKAPAVIDVKPAPKKTKRK